MGKPKTIKVRMKSEPQASDKYTPWIHCSYTDLGEVSKLKPHPKNPNKHTEDQIARLAKILNYQGFRRPIIVSNRSGFIVAGHGTLEAAKKNAWTHVPINFQDFEDDDQEYAFIVSDNAIAEWAALDLSLVNNEVQNLDGMNFNIDLLGLKDFEISPLDREGNTDADEIPEIKEGPTKCKTGDLWILDDHRLLVGDCSICSGTRCCRGGFYPPVGTSS